MGKRILRISDAFLFQMFEPGHDKHYRVLRDGLPPDCTIVDVAMEGTRERRCGDAAFLLQSESWAPSPEGEPYPEITPLICGLYPRDGEYRPYREDQDGIENSFPVE